MATKTCSRCGKDLPLRRFTWKSRAKGLRHAHCKDCQKGYFQEHYQKNRQTYIKRARKSNTLRRKKLREFLTELRSVPCADCGQTFPTCVMEFDHRDPSKKLGNVASLADFRFSLSALKREIAKCDVVCANCHCLRTHARR